MIRPCLYFLINCAKSFTPFSNRGDYTTGKMIFKGFFSIETVKSCWIPPGFPINMDGKSILAVNMNVPAGHNMYPFNSRMLSEKSSRQAEQKLQLPNALHQDHIQLSVIRPCIRAELKPAALISLIHNCRKIYVIIGKVFSPSNVTVIFPGEIKISCFKAIKR